MLEEKSVVKLSEGISLYGGANEANKFYVFNTLTGDYFSVNAFGFSALSKIDGVLTIGQIVDASIAAINVGRDIYLRDIVELFENCVERNVLELA